MAEIKDCIGKRVKISKNSITIKSEDNKTCGVVRDIVSLYNMQPNKQMVFMEKIKKLKLSMKDISIKDIIIKDEEMYIFRNIKTKLYYKEHGFFDVNEKEKIERIDKQYEALKNAGIEIIECIYC